MIDAHCHIDAYPDPLGAAVAADRAAILTIAVTNTPVDFERAYPHVRRLRYLRLALGLHPLSRQTEPDLRKFEMLLERTSYVGEVGLDFSRRGAATRQRQELVFRRIAHLVAHTPRFMTVHSRGAEGAVADILDEAGTGPVVFHWYTGSQQTLERVLAAGHLCSVNPSMVASPRGRAIIAALPRDRVLTETDGPFTKVGSTPAKPNDVAIVVRHLADVWQQSESEVEAQLQRNLRAAVPDPSG